MDYGKHSQYSDMPSAKRLSEKEDSVIPYRYVRTFKQTSGTQLVEMDKANLQAYVNRLLGTKGLTSSINEGKSN